MRDVAGAEADDEIAAAGDAVHHAGKVRRFLQRNHFAMTVSAQAQHEMIAIDAWNRRLAGRGDFVVCLGAGNITQWAYALPGELKALG